ncbi:MAG: hypothetical protein J1E82_04580 [Muribaculaceae bacterium]|nr:hypothetical protein [Muribaculaceae bacterium]
MAKTPVKIEIDGYKEREVLMVEYGFTQETDVEGQMSGIPRGGKIRVRVKALNDGTPDLLAWMVERNLPKNVVITFNETKTGKEMKRIEITNGYCVEFEENWEDKMGHFEEIVITCKEIKFGNVVYQNDWA